MGVEPVASHGAFGVELGERDPGHELGLGQALAPGDPAALEPPASSEPVSLRVDLVHPVQRGALLGVEFGRLALERPGSEDRAVLDQVGNLAAESRPGIFVEIGNDQSRHVAGRCYFTDRR
ncbi:hypothetical protein [Pimelobacter simplex]|uniref:hypothetical protein n=1 Tax=Nocardioides simplex TaxID=2045 RepID=UPI001C206A5E|nr:hypothetical protein [Pimelobacter simplex]